jgi:tripartite-type tricarboxylate transporter receptor subunit TctC
MKNSILLLLKTFTVMLTLSSVSAVCASPLFAAADIYPSKPVRLIVPNAPGAGPDIFARLMAVKLSERLAKQFIVENHAGAGGVIGSEMAAKAVPDGYTLLFVAAFYPNNAALYKLPFDPVNSFTPIAKLGSSPAALFVHPSVPANSVKELIALAKQKPGQLLWAASGVGSNQHLQAELFKTKTGIDVKIVQFKGGSSFMNDILGGHSQIGISTIVQAIPFIKAGNVRALGVGGLKRSTILPDVPTISEAGVPGYEATGWWGMLAPAGTPVAIVEKLNNEFKAILISDELKKFFASEGAQMDYLAPAEFGAFVSEQITRWTQVVKDANIKVEN